MTMYNIWRKPVTKGRFKMPGKYIMDTDGDFVHACKTLASCLGIAVFPLPADFFEYEIVYNHEGVYYSLPEYN